MGLQNLLSYSVNLADNMMLGQYSETSLAASSIINQIQYLLQMTSVNGLGAGGVILIAQYWGKGDHQSVRRIIALTMKFAIGAGVLFCVVCVAAPEGVVSLLTDETAVAADAVRYLRVIGVTYLIFPMQAALVLCLRGVGITRLGPVVSLVSGQWSESVELDRPHIRGHNRPRLCGAKQEAAVAVGQLHRA